VSVDRASGISAPKSDLVFLHNKSGMTVIVTHTDEAWRMADVIWVDGGARNPKDPALFQVADVDTEVINWVNADFVTHIVQGSEAPVGAGRGRSGFGMQTAALPDKNHLTINSSFK